MWHRLIQRHNMKAQVWLLANKCDLQGGRAVLRSEGESLTAELGFDRYVEVSAKTTEGLDGFGPGHFVPLRKTW